MNRLIALGIGLLIAAYLLFSSIYVVNVREQAIVLRFGQITAVRTEPGIYFKVPTSLVETVQLIENRLLRYDIANMQLQVSDGATYVVDAFLTYRVTDPVKFRERVQGDLGLAEQRISTRFDAALRQVYGVRKFDAALSAERPEMMKEARDKIRPGMAELGIEVVDVRILRTDLMEDVSKQTFERMSAERNAEAARIRAGGQQAAQSLKAIADRQKVEILAAALRDSEILRGEGEAQSSQIFADAFNRDPEFYEFYRSLQSYRQSLGPSDTTMVLSPNSEFFRYFENINPTGAKPPEGATDVEVPATPLIQQPADETPATEVPITEVPAVDPAPAATTEAPATLEAPTAAPTATPAETPAVTTTQ